MKTIARAIDDFLAWFALECDATPRTVASYWTVLRKLADRYPEALMIDFDGKVGTDRLREFLTSWVKESKNERGVELSAATRANIISVLHSFFGWAEGNDLVETDPSRKIRRPPKRRPPVKRASADELRRL